MAAGIAALDPAHQHGGRLPAHLLAGNVEGGELHMAAFGADMAAKHHRRKVIGNGQAALAGGGLDAHRIGKLDEEGSSRATAEESIKDLVGRTSDRFDMQHHFEAVAERGRKASPAIDDGFRRTRRADIGKLRMPQSPCLLDESPGTTRIIAADIGNGSARILASADRHERIIARDQPRQLGAIEFAAEHQAAIGDPEPVAVGKDLAVLPDAGSRQKQKVVILDLRLFLDAEQKGCEEVRLGARERRLVGEHAENAIQPLGHAPGDGIGDVTCRADDLLDPLAGFLRNTRQSCRRTIQHKRNGCLAHAGQFRNIVLGQALRRGHATSSLSPLDC